MSTVTELPPLPQKSDVGKAIDEVQHALAALRSATESLRRTDEGVSDANYDKLMSDITSLNQRVDDLLARNEDEQDVDSKVSDWMACNFEITNYDTTGIDVDYQIAEYIEYNDVKIDIEDVTCSDQLTERVTEIVKEVLAESTFAVVEPAEEEEKEEESDE